MTDCVSAYTSTSVWEGDPWDFPMLRALVASGKLRGAASVSAHQQSANQDLGEANNEDFVPSLAYGILGSKDDTDRIYRLLLATYHPRNLYAVYRQESVFADNALFERRRGGRWIADMRDRVTRFEVYTGSFPLLASRPLIRYLIDEPHAIPRRMLMFLGDTLSPHLHYMPTAACQAARFNHSVVNSGLHFPPFTVTQGHEMPSVNSSLWQNLTGRGAFGGGAPGGGPFLFVHDVDPGLVTKIDRELLHREEESVVDCRMWCIPV
ncbi:unnamed protein product [Closterium sp. Yama58-4]|nr:unnamed protein product [Closterium sp. Yama58-4]